MIYTIAFFVFFGLFLELIFVLGLIIRWRHPKQFHFIIFWLRVVVFHLIWAVEGGGRIFTITSNYEDDYREYIIGGYF